MVNKFINILIHDILLLIVAFYLFPKIKTVANCINNNYNNTSISRKPVNFYILILVLKMSYDCGYRTGSFRFSFSPWFTRSFKSGPAFFYLVRSGLVLTSLIYTARSGPVLVVWEKKQPHCVFHLIGSSGPCLNFTLLILFIKLWTAQSFNGQPRKKSF